MQQDLRHTTDARQGRRIHPLLPQAVVKCVIGKMPRHVAPCANERFCNKPATVRFPGIPASQKGIALLTSIGDIFMQCSSATPGFPPTTRTQQPSRRRSRPPGASASIVRRPLTDAGTGPNFIGYWSRDQEDGFQRRQNGRRCSPAVQNPPCHRIAPPNGGLRQIAHKV